jgi:arylsulfatase A-like enzyme
VPCVMRWPGVIKPGQVINGQASLQDFIPTFAAAPNIDQGMRRELSQGTKF